MNKVTIPSIIIVETIAIKTTTTTKRITSVVLFIKGTCGNNAPVIVGVIIDVVLLLFVLIIVGRHVIECKGVAIVVVVDIAFVNKDDAVFVTSTEIELLFGKSRMFNVLLSNMDKIAIK